MYCDRCETPVHILPTPGPGVDIVPCRIRAQIENNLQVVNTQMVYVRRNEGGGMSGYND
jgi:hypothetical protein